MPGFPLDGGRVLRSIIWAATGSLTKATNAAALAGRVFGWGLIIFGLFQLLTGNFLGGLWIAFIGWFLHNAADASRKEVTVRERLSTIKIKNLMGPAPETVTPDTSVDQLVSNILHRKYDRATPVCRDGQLLGIVTITDIRELPREKWTETPVAQIMTRHPLYTVSPEDTLDKAMSLLSKHDINQVIIEQQQQCAGILQRADIIKYLQLNQELNRRQ
jgi:CBS domain-containing protein